MSIESSTTQLFIYITYKLPTVFFHSVIGNECHATNMDTLKCLQVLFLQTFKWIYNFTCIIKQKIIKGIFDVNLTCKLIS